MAGYEEAFSGPGMCSTDEADELSPVRAGSGVVTRAKRETPADALADPPEFEGSSLSHEVIQEGVKLSPAEEYAGLKRTIEQRGLLNKRPVYYTSTILLTLSLLALSIAFLVLIDNIWLQLANAAFLAFVFGQFAFIGHDGGHHQIFTSKRGNEIVGLVICFLLAFDRSWWVDKHNRHHSYPNDVALDPDSNIPVLAFTKDQARSKRGIYRFIVKYQAYFFLPMLALEGFGLRLASVQYLLRTKVKFPVAEPLLIASHFVVYFALLFYLLDPWHALLFIFVHQALFGLYMGASFAPNHKGMPMLDNDTDMDFLRRQVITARNIKGHPFTDFWYGGLNYQIEHHLFPSMPRNAFKEAQKIIKPFCQTHHIPYHETGTLQAQREILRSLHQESAPLRDGSL
ncbi:MAG: acyl-CoA desaturase [Chloroflexi bacterium]|nr:acyl-CoA desaturase [Chloroflexota bacterium]